MERFWAVGSLLCLEQRPPFYVGFLTAAAIAQRSTGYPVDIYRISCAIWVQELRKKRKKRAGRVSSYTSVSSAVWSTTEHT